jgi:hypothetical protein
MVMKRMGSHEWNVLADNRLGWGTMVAWERTDEKMLIPERGPSKG